MKKILGLFILSLLAGLYSSQSQTSTNLYYDPSTTSGIGGSGSWSTTGLNWTTNPAGTTALISGSWTNSATWTNNNANNAILQGTAGNITLSGTIYANQIQVNTTGFTVGNNSISGTSANRYFRTKNGIILGDGVNLNITSGITTNGAITGFEGSFTNAVGAANTSVTIVGATLNSDSSVRIGLDSSATDIGVPLNVATSGNGYACITVSGTATVSIYGNVSVANNSRLVLGHSGMSSARRINVRGNLTTVNTDLTIGEVGLGGVIVLYGTNSIGGNVVANGPLGFGSTNAFGASVIVLNNGATFGATSFGTGASDRTLPNNLSVLGNVIFGLNGLAGFTSGAGSYLGGNINLNNATRTFTITNTTYFRGAVTNGGISLNAGTNTVTAFFNGTNSLSALSWTNGTVALGSLTNSIGTLTMTGPASGTNTSPSLQLDLGVTPSPSTGGSIVITGTNNKIIATNSVTGTAITGTTNITLLAGTSVDISGLSSNGVVLSGGLVGGTNVSVVLNGPTVIRPDRTTYKFVSTPTVLELQVGLSSALDLSWGGGDGNWDTSTQNWSNGGEPISFNTGDNASITGGVLTLDASGISAGAVTVSGDTTFNGGSLTVVSLTKNGPETLTLNISGTYTQGLTINEGTLDIGANNQTTTALALTQGSIIGTGIIQATSASCNQDFGDITNTIAVGLAGNFSFTKSGLGATVLSGPNSYLGDTVISAGTLMTFGNEVLPDTVVTLGTGATLQLGGDETLKSIGATQAAGATVDLQNHTLTLNVTVSNSYASVITGASGGRLVKNGASILTINENNTYSGGTTLNDGAFRLQASGNRITNGDSTVILASSPFGLGTLTIAGGRIFSSGTSGRTIYNNVDITGNSSFGDSSSTQNGDITVSTNVTGAATTLSADTILTTLSLADWEQAITGSTFNFTKAGTNRLVLRGSNNLNSLTVQAGRLDLRGVNTIASGQIDVQAGASLGWGTTNGALGSCVIKLGNGSAIGQAGDMGTTLTHRTITNAVDLAGDFVLGLGGYSSYLGMNFDLKGQNRRASLTNSTFILGKLTNGGITVDAGLYTNLTGSTLRTLTLSASNDFSSGVTLTSTNSGTNKTSLVLAVAHDQALGAGTLTFAATTSATLRAAVANRSLANNIVISNGVSGIFDVGTNGVVAEDQSVTNTVTSDMSLSGSISGGGALIKTNTGLLTLSGALSYSGATTVSGGTLRIQKTGLTADITTNTVSISFSPAPATGTNNILPGILNGTYAANDISISGLGAGQVATFNTANGTVVVTASGPTFDSAYPGKSLSELAPNGQAYLVNYAFGGSSTTAAKLPVQGTSDSTKLTLHAFVRTNDNTVSVVGEVGATLTNWDTNNTIPGLKTTDQAGAPEGTERRAFTVNATEDRQFLRLKISK